MPSYIVTYDIRNANNIAQWMQGDDPENDLIRKGIKMAKSTYAVTSDVATADDLYEKIAKQFSFNFKRKQDPDWLTVVRVYMQPGGNSVRSSSPDEAKIKPLFDECPQANSGAAAPLKYHDR